MHCTAREVATVHSIFQTSISQNTKCADIIGFLKDAWSQIFYTQK